MQIIITFRNYFYEVDKTISYYFTDRRVDTEMFHDISPLILVIYYITNNLKMCHLQITNFHYITRIMWIIFRIKNPRVA